MSTNRQRLRVSRMKDAAASDPVACLPDCSELRPVCWRAEQDAEEGTRLSRREDARYVSKGREVCVWPRVRLFAGTTIC